MSPDTSSEARDHEISEGDSVLSASTPQELVHREAGSVSESRPELGQAGLFGQRRAKALKTWGPLLMSAILVALLVRSLCHHNSKRSLPGSEVRRLADSGSEEGGDLPRPESPDFAELCQALGDWAPEFPLPGDPRASPDLVETLLASVETAGELGGEAASNLSAVGTFEGDQGASASGTGFKALRFEDGDEVESADPGPSSQMATTHGQTGSEEVSSQRDPRASPDLLEAILASLEAGGELGGEPFTSLSAVGTFEGDGGRFVSGTGFTPVRSKEGDEVESPDLGSSSQMATTHASTGFEQTSSQGDPRASPDVVEMFLASLEAKGEQGGEAASSLSAVGAFERDQGAFASGTVFKPVRFEEVDEVESFDSGSSPQIATTPGQTAFEEVSPQRDPRASPDLVEEFLASLVAEAESVGEASTSPSAVQTFEGDQGAPVSSTGFKRLRSEEGDEVESSDSGPSSKMPRTHGPTGVEQTSFHSVHSGDEGTVTGQMSSVEPTFDSGSEGSPGVVFVGSPRPTTSSSTAPTLDQGASTSSGASGLAVTSVSEGDSPREHPFARIPRLQPGVEPPQLSLKWIKTEENLSHKLCFTLRGMRELFLKPELDRTDAIKLVCLAQELATQAYSTMSQDVSHYMPARAIEYIARRFLVMWSLHAASQALHQDWPNEPWWREVVDKISSQYTFLSGRRYHKTEAYTSLIDDLRFAIEKLKRGEPLPAEVVIDLKRRIFCLPNSPSRFTTSWWDPWRKDDCNYPN
ncbi:hypothetical protein Emed_005644 [Eimeria media]